MQINAFRKQEPLNLGHSEKYSFCSLNVCLHILSPAMGSKIIALHQLRVKSVSGIDTSWKK